MFFIAGVGSRIKPTGDLNCACPACGRQVPVHVCKKYSVLTLFFIPVFPFGGEYIATCPSCASVMELERKTGKALSKSPDITVPPEALRILQNNAGSSCYRCGSKVRRGQNFCANCGEPV